MSMFVIQVRDPQTWSLLRQTKTAEPVRAFLKDNRNRRSQRKKKKAENTKNKKRKKHVRLFPLVASRQQLACISRAEGSTKRTRSTGGIALLSPPAAATSLLIVVLKGHAQRCWKRHRYTTQRERKRGFIQRRPWF